MTTDVTRMSRHDPDCIYSVFAIDSMGGSALDDMNDTYSAVTGCSKRHTGRHTAELFSADYTLHINRTAFVCSETGKSITYLIPDSTASCRLWKITVHVNGGKLYLQGSAVCSAGNGIMPASLHDTEVFAGAVSAVHTDGVSSAEHITGISAGYAQTLLRSDAAGICMTDDTPVDVCDIMDGELVHLSFLPSVNQNSVQITIIVKKMRPSSDSNICGCTALCTAHTADGHIIIEDADNVFMAMLGKGLITEDELTAADALPRSFISRGGVRVCCIPSGTDDRILIAAAEPRYTIGRCINRGYFLTKLEYKVMMLAASGMTDKGVAFSMKTHESSVKKILRRCCMKLGVSNRVEMSARAGLPGDLTAQII